MRTAQDEVAVRRDVYVRDNAANRDILAGVEFLFIRLAIAMLRPGERILDAFAYHADYLDVTNPFRPHPRIRPALACLTRTRLVEVRAARGGLAAVPSAAWVIRHASDMEFVTVDLADVTAVCTRRAVRGPGITHDVVLELRHGEQHRIGSHATSARAEAIADRVRHRLGALHGRIRGNRAPERW
ncbi:MAG TPA: hypothetical protein VHF06_29855 [Pseudonocardiaceae bacterium]|jgi:hypothetical protein|nr:hypothetical protein [Pseudonocardiaceae bacterium]